jgi:arylsulfatase A-like enzyme
MFADPTRDSRAPDLIAITQVGVIYAGPAATKLAEHGGFSENDTHVLLVVSRAGGSAKQVDEQVETRQIAPTILRALGLSPAALDAVRVEGTRALPLGSVLAGKGSGEGDSE